MRAVTTDGSAQGSSSSATAARRPRCCPWSASATATPSKNSSATEAIVKSSVTFSAFQKRGSMARKA